MVTARLYIGLAVAAVFAALLAAALIYRHNAAAARADLAVAHRDLAQAKQANDQQAEAIRDLTLRRELDDKLLADIQSKIGDLASQTKQATAAIRDLERSNADVQTYLAGKLPDDLKRVLNQSTTGNTDKSPK